MKVTASRDLQPHLEALANLLVVDASLPDTLLRVSEIVVEALEAETASICLLDHMGRPTSVAATDADRTEIDAAQHTSGRGPCLQAWRTQVAVRVDDVAEAEPTYPEFARSAQRHGVLSSLSLPLIAGGECIGAVTLHVGVVHGFSADEQAMGATLASAAAADLANARAYWAALETGRQLSEALTSRAVIEQAKGMLMAQSSNLCPSDAFELLRQASQRENCKVRDIAARIVDRRPWSAGPGPKAPA